MCRPCSESRAKADPHYSEKQRLRGSPVPDPFVIACANVSAGTVVTQEVKKEGGSKIPNVCEHFKIKWTNLEGSLAENGDPAR